MHLQGSASLRSALPLYWLSDVWGHPGVTQVTLKPFFWSCPPKSHWSHVPQVKGQRATCAGFWLVFLSQRDRKDDCHRNLTPKKCVLAWPGSLAHQTPPPPSPHHI